jgi:hypothetical protein
MRPPPIKTAKKGGYTDVALYKDITKQVVAGSQYHTAAAQLQRQHHYPTKPFVTVRPPTLVMMAAWFGWSGVQKICLGVVALGVFCWAICLETKAHWTEQVLIAGAIGFGGGGVLRESLMALHEYPAGMLMTVGLAGMLGWPRKWWLVVPPVLAGLLVRELVLPFVLLALVFAAWQRRWAEVAAWGAVVAVFGAFMAWHAHEVALVVRPGDITSVGWHALQGFPGFLKAVIFTSALQQLPLGWGLLAAMLPCVGWLALSGREGLFAQIMVAGYILLIALFSRADTFYWGAIVLPWYFAGYGLLPRAFWQLYTALRGPAAPDATFA